MKHNNQKNANVVYCPLCGESVGLPTKRGANKANPILPLLPRLTAVLPPQGREITTRGFTLIELLVVVLIIGILAAVAVPQYQKAVVKSRLAAIKPILTALKNAEETYYLANGEYAAKHNQLDISLPCQLWNMPQGIFTHCDKYFHIELLHNDKQLLAFYCPDKTDSWPDCWNHHLFKYSINLNHHETEPNKITCTPAPLNNLAKAICKGYN